MIRQIVAIDSNRGIAKRGRQPWSLPSDMNYFKERTMSHGGAVLMGHKTLLIIGHPLADRQNFVLSRDPSLKIEGVVVVNDLPIFLASLQTDIWIIGGAEIYAQTLSYVDELYITRIDAAFDCDQFYPELGDGLVETWRSGTQQENGLEFTQFIYKRQA